MLHDNILIVRYQGALYRQHDQHDSVSKWLEKIEKYPRSV